MATANSKDKDEQTRQERARAAIEAYKPRYDGGVRTEVRRLDVDGVLARSFKNVQSNNLALNQQSFEQGKAT